MFICKDGMRIDSYNGVAWYIKNTSYGSFMISCKQTKNGNVYSVELIRGDY